MKIAQITPFFYPDIGGVSQHVLEISKEFVNRGHEVHVFTTKTKNIVSSERVEGVFVHRFPVIFSISEFAKIWNFIPSLLKLKPDIIHTHVYGHPHSFFSILFANTKGIPSVITTHAPFLEPKLRKFYLRLLVNINDLTFGKVSLSMVDRIIAISNWEIKYLLKLSAKKEKIRVIPNGVPKEFFRKVDGNSFRKKFNLHKKVILFFGRVHPVKGVDILIKAVPLLSEEVNVVVVGPYEKDYCSELNSLIKSLKIENIVFTGPVKSLKEKIGVYSACDLFVLPSLREAFPLTLLEAMAIGKPVISSETNGAKEVIKDGYNGLFFKTGDPKDLANKINLLLSDRSMQRRLGENGKKVARNYTWDKIVDKIEDVYKEIV